MIRNLKALVFAAMALVFAAIDISGAAAAEYHCEVETGKSCKVTLTPDGTAKNSHHLFVVKKGAASLPMTCNSLSGEATLLKTATEATVTNLAYAGCNVAGSPFTVDTAGCDYLFKSNGGSVNVVCEGGKTIKITFSSCTIEIGPQALAGITYTNINSKKEVTASPTVKGISGVGSAGCSFFGINGAFTEAEYTTGNVIAKAFKDESGSEGAQVNGWWE